MRLVYHEAASVRLPRDNMRGADAVDLVQHFVQADRKRFGDTVLGDWNWGQGNGHRRRRRGKRCTLAFARHAFAHDRLVSAKALVEVVSFEWAHGLALEAVQIQLALERSELGLAKVAAQSVRMRSGRSSVRMQERTEA